MDGPLTREDKLRIRALAADLAWERIEPQHAVTNDPAVRQLLLLDQVIYQLRTEAQPRAREAAGKLDEFIRSRNLDRFIARKTDYYYRADQIPKDEIEKLEPGDKREFAALAEQTGARLREFKDGFRSIDNFRLKIEGARNSQPVTLSPEGDGRAHNGLNGSGKQLSLQSTGQTSGQDRRVKDPAPDREPVDESHLADRSILGNAVIAHTLADCAAHDYERARDYGHTFRFKIRDECLGWDRSFSQLDVTRRAEARGQRAADERGSRRSDDRRAIREQVFEADLRLHSSTLGEHGKILDGLVAKLGSKAKDALSTHHHVQQLATEVVEKYQKRGEPALAPFAERETLVRAQDQAIAHGFADHTERLEQLRLALVEEHGQPLRSEEEAARLAAQLFVAHTELRAREERATRFDETRHLRQWEIRGERLSLAEIDRRIEQASDKAQFVGRREYHILPGERREASAEVERLSAIRAEIIEKIGEQQGELREGVSQSGKLLDTLARAYKREASLRDESGLPTPDPHFTRQELERAADNIQTTRDADLLRQLSAFEGQFNRYADAKERFNPAEGWGRAPARAVVAEIFHSQSSERLAAFEQRGEIQPLLIETPDGRLITHRLQDARSQSPVEWLVRTLAETPAQGEIRGDVQAAFTEYKNRLQTDVERTTFYLQAAREIASHQVAERNLRAGHEPPAPEPKFTPKELIEIEIYAERQADPKEREYYLALVRDGAQSRSDPYSQTRSPEPDVPREVASGPGRGR